MQMKCKMENAHMANAPCRWDTTILPVWIGNISIDISERVVRETTIKALRRFSNAVNLIFPLAGEPRTAKLVISFRTIDGVNGVLGQAWFPPPCGGRKAGHIEIDQDEAWMHQDLLGVTMHEVGHALGLPHNGNEESIMYPAFNGITHLSDLDRANLRELYPMDEAGEIPGKPPEVPSIIIPDGANRVKLSFEE